MAYRYIKPSLGLTLMLTMASGWAEWHDPMMPFGYQASGMLPSDTGNPLPVDSSGFKLTAIFIDPKGNRAVINDRHLRTGDKLSGAQVMVIDPHAIELDIQGERVKLELLPITIKTPSKILPGGGE